MNTSGDGFLAMFDGPQRAIRCAVAIRDAVQALGIAVRGGLHTGECEIRGDDIGGIAVHIGARVSALAGPNEVLVSSTLRDLVIGSGARLCVGQQKNGHPLLAWSTPTSSRSMTVVRRRGDCGSPPSTSTALTPPRYCEIAIPPACLPTTPSPSRPLSQKPWTTTPTCNARSTNAASSASVFIWTVGIRNWRIGQHDCPDPQGELREGIPSACEAEQHEGWQQVARAGHRPSRLVDSAENT